MFAKMRKEVDQLLAQVSKFGDVRRHKIKKFEENLIKHVENEVIGLVASHGFTVTEHQLSNWIVAVRGQDKLRVWFPQQASESNSGAYTINFVLNDTKYAVGVLIKHRYANLEYNYLTVDYQQELQDKINKLHEQLKELRRIDTSDIDGSYMACRYVSGTGDSLQFQTLESCLTDLINKQKSNL